MSKLGALAEVARLINERRIQEAHDILAAIEKDEQHEAQTRPIAMMILRERITKAKGSA